MSGESYLSLDVLRDDQRATVGKMLAVSVALHLCLLALLTGLRFSPSAERPLASYQVSLVSMPRPALSATPPLLQSPEPDRPRKVAEPPPSPTRVPEQSRQATAIPKTVRPSAPKVAPAFAAPLEDVLRGIKLPPEVPKLGKLSPVPAASPLHRSETSKKEIDKLLSKLQVPEVQVLPPFPQESSMAAKESPPPQVVAAKPAGLNKPATAIQVPGATGFNQYLARVQNKISSQWIAPQVDLTGRTLQVVIKFRLDRSGVVSNVSVEKTSGNEYYDVAGTRAVLSANPLPPFPREMSDANLDAHFSFTVGEQSG